MNDFSTKDSKIIQSADPKASYLAHKEALDKIVTDILESGSYIMGPKVKLFEENFAKYNDTKYCTGVANGTDAIQLALRACAINPGDFIMTVSHTAVATVSAIVWMGAVPVLVDINDTYTIDPQKAEETLRKDTSKKIKAMISVHLYGNPADMEILNNLAERYNIIHIEDCAQAHGALIKEKKTGSMGICGTFSFYPTKNLGAFGDGGAIITNDQDISNRLKLLQQYGWKKRYISEEIGYNSRLDELQAAILDYKLTWLDVWNDRRRKIAEMYKEALSQLPIELPVETEGNKHVYHQFVIRLNERNALQKYLKAKKITTSILYPLPVHLQPGYSKLYIRGEGGMFFTEKIAKEILCLPVYPELADADVIRVIEDINSFFS